VCPEEAGRNLRFDDRLLTVLNQPAGDRHDVAVRWRQLVDLVARAGSNSASPVVAEAMAAIRDETSNVDEQLRAAAARAVAALPLPLTLLEYFASDRLAVSAPVLAAATLDAAQWQVLIASADEETRRFVETLHPEIAAGPGMDLTEALIETPAEKQAASPAQQPPAGPSLGEVVARIERRRRNRALQQTASWAGPGAAAGLPAMFRWECGPGGDIAWIEGAPRGPLIGRSIARKQEQNGDVVATEVVRAFAVRAPFRDATLAIAGEGPVAGEWKISGVPAFDPADGRFAGYRGVAVREQVVPLSLESALSLLPDPDSLRELVHEIKTPLNAIIGFAEIIDGQFLGPADRGYRDRAAEIVSQARLLLSAIDDLDFAARIHSSPAAKRRTNLGELTERIAPSLREFAEAQEAELDCSRTTKNLEVAVEPELAERLILRMCNAIIERAQPKERLRLSVDQANDHCRVSISRPAALQGLADSQLFELGLPGSRDEDRASVLSAGLMLRLARGLARIAGADLATSPAAVSLVFPRA
jgi:signal transduction histidine kinase